MSTQAGMVKGSGFSVVNSVHRSVHGCLNKTKYYVLICFEKIITVFSSICFVRYFLYAVWIEIVE